MDFLYQYNFKSNATNGIETTARIVQSGTRTPDDLVSPSNFSANILVAVAAGVAEAIKITVAATVLS